MPERVKNTMAKTRDQNDPYEIWTGPGGWEWHVLKKWQVDDDKPFARWFCLVKSPFVPEGELGDVYVSEIKQHAVKTFPKEDVRGGS